MQAQILVKKEIVTKLREHAELEPADIESINKHGGAFDMLMV